MVEQTSETTYATDGLNELFACLSDPTRRDILERLRQGPMNVGGIACEYDASLAAVAKHIALLEAAGLVVKRKHGKERLVSLTPGIFVRISAYASQFEPAE